MSAENSNATYPHPWLQPVRYDLDEFRAFAGQLDIRLQRLVAQHRTGRCLSSQRGGALTIQRQDTIDPQTKLPPGTHSC